MRLNSSLRYIGQAKAEISSLLCGLFDSPNSLTWLTWQCYCAVDSTGDIRHLESDDDGWIDGGLTVLFAASILEVVKGQ